MLVIGDVHGNINSFEKIIYQHKGDSIQLGDFGFKKHHDYFLNNFDLESNSVLFGNHDYYPYLREPHSLGDYGCDHLGELFFVRGAYSIDKHIRTIGVDWFENEEMTYQTFKDVINKYELVKPKIVISHDCPQSLRESLFGIHEKSMTSNGLQAMFEIHQPDLWIFGHHHKSKNVNINGTNFRCLAELEAFLI